MKRKIIATIILFVSMLVGSYIYKTNYIQINSNKSPLDIKSKYDASEDIGIALSSLDISKKAELITNTNSLSNIVSLSFEGLSDRDTMEKITEMLDKYGIKATFFIPGIKAAEDSRIVEVIQKGGHDIGNGTLNWKKNMQNLSSEDLVDDFCRTNSILKSITGKVPTLIKCNSTMYNDNILSSAYAAGNKYIVNSDHYISYQSFKNYDQTYKYLKNLKNGTIVSIKLEGVLDINEYGEKRVNEKPAIDKQAGINEVKVKEEEVDITQIVEWLLKAITQQDKSAVKVSELQYYEGYSEPLYYLNSDGNNTISKINSNDNLKYISNNKSNKTNSLQHEEQKNIIDNDKYYMNFDELIAKNNGKQAPVVSQFFTTQKALSYTFRGLSNESSLDNVLEKLDEVNAKGTFFVTKEEILKYPERINKILSKGHEIGNGGITTNTSLTNKSTGEICEEIYEVHRILKEKGINTNAYMPGYGYITPEIKEALSTINQIFELKDYELFTYTKAPIINKYKGLNAEEIVSNYFDVNSYVSLRKGEIVYFRLDSDLFGDNVIANMIDVLTRNYVKDGYVSKYNEESQAYDLVKKPLGYSLVTLRNLQNTIETSTQLGRYNIVKNQTILKKRNNEETLKMMKTNYIGNKYIDLADFSSREQLLLDKSGTINTNGENVIFFTFDDWGGDPVVNELLDVLNKHKVKATFFAIGKYTDINNDISNANPNLLRTIALSGNDIGSHNYNHELLAVKREELEESLTKSYGAMDKIIGDLDSLRLYFRPPTLFLRKEGLFSVFESGYKYCVNGNITTHDYERPSAQNIVDYIVAGLVRNKGNIIIMHMNDQSYYTAEAVDIFLTNNEKGMYGVKYKVAKLSDYLEK